MKNFRPVSNVPFLSKLLERAIQRRLQEFFDSNGMMASTQSVYRQFHSTKTAVNCFFNEQLSERNCEQCKTVTKVYSDLLIAADKG